MKRGIKTRLLERATEGLPELPHEDFKQQIVKDELSKITEEQGRKCARSANRDYLLKIFQKYANEDT